MLAENRKKRLEKGERLGRPFAVSIAAGAAERKAVEVVLKATDALSAVSVLRRSALRQAGKSVLTNARRR